MAIDPRRLLIFRDVVRAGSISAAARTLGWTQPAVSQHLSHLEREAGSPLLLRGPAGVRLTEAGATLMRRADAVAGELHAAGEELATLADLHSGRVRLAAFPSSAATLVPAAMAALAARNPGIRVELAEAEPPAAMAAVMAGDLDLALVFGHRGAPDDTGGLVWRPLLEEPVRLVVPAGHPAEGGTGDLAALAGETWVGGCERCRGHLLTCCREAGFEPALSHTTDDYVLTQNLVANRLGVTLLPASALAAYRHPGVAVVAAPHLGTRHVGLVHRPGADVVPATAALLRELSALHQHRDAVE